MSKSKPPSGPRDPLQVANLAADLADTGANKEVPRTEDGRDLAAVLLGRRGGLKGGLARAAALSPDERRRIAAKAARARWEKLRG